MSMLSRCINREQQHGFTLLELLVASFVMAILLTVIGSMLTTTFSTLQRNNRIMSAIEDNRFALDAIGNDLNKRLVRTDLPITLLSQSGNDTLLFESYVPSASLTGSDARGVSLVSYRIADGNRAKPYTLQRAAIATSWNGSGSPLLFVSSTSTASIPIPADQEFDTISDSVFRIEFCFVYADGTIKPTAPQSPLEFRENVKAVVATVASLAPIGRKQLASPASQLQTLCAAFPDTTGTNTPIHTWLQIVNDPTTLSRKTGLPASLISTIRVGERIYYVR